MESQMAVSAFQQAAAEGFPSPSPCSSLHGVQSVGSGVPTPPEATQSRAQSRGLSLGEPTGSYPERRLSLNISRQGSANPFAKRPALWRESLSTAVSEKAAALGYASLQELCGNSYIPPERLRKRTEKGEGAFAVVEIAQLLPPPDSNEPWPQGGSSSGRAQQVAVKRLKDHVLEDENDVCNFIHEARLLLNLQHPSVVQYIGLGSDDDSTREAQWRTMYLVQEFATGGTLKKLILTQMINPTRKLYSLQDAVRWGIQMAEGLAYLHSINPMIIHRDLKAENVLLASGAGGHLDAKLADFGLHKLVRRAGRKAQWSFCDIREEGATESVHGAGEAGLHLSANSASFGSSSTPGGSGADRSRQQSAAEKPGLRDITALSRMSAGEDSAAARKLLANNVYKMTGKTGAFIYMAPEVYLTKPYNEKVDVFSFGVILYELLHRKMILSEIMYLGSAEDCEAFACQVAGGHRVPISADLPLALQKLVDECWSGTPELRPSMTEVARRLKEVQQSGELESLEHRHGPQAAGCCTVM